MFGRAVLCTAVPAEIADLLPWWRTCLGRGDTTRSGVAPPFLRAIEGDPPFAAELATLPLGEFRRVARAATGSNPLSEREREVLQLVARGYTYRHAGRELFMAEKTVENHVRNILNKLRLSRRAELILWAADHGIN